MSGHSKWSTIKHKKGALDAKRGQLFGQLAKNITAAAREGKSADPNQNPSLRLAIDKARSANMPGENIKRAIDRGMGIGGGGPLAEVTYEGYGPGGVGFMVIVSTNNRNKTGAEIRYIFESNGGSLGGPGSTAYLFNREGNKITTKVPLPVTDPSTTSQIAKLKSTLESHEDVISVHTNQA